ncbi:MAG: hypothetical protein RBS57_01075 [Desulforhabdus sp.]|nr:hypothetical protein [Desulforhabdus sp.]
MHERLDMAEGPPQSSAVHFYKYSVYGNILVLVDELQGRRLSEPEKSAFARLATDEHFGIGCDNLLFIQPYSDDLIRSIAEYRHYWDDYPTDLGPDIDFVFRVFKQDGEEELCCGNGLLSVAHLLNWRHGLKTAKILTEIPCARPRTRHVRTLEPQGVCCANMGAVEIFPERFVKENAVQCKQGCVSITEDLKIAFQVKAMDGSIQDFNLPVQGILAFSGEPHLVIIEKQKELMAERRPTIAVDRIERKLAVVPALTGGYGQDSNGKRLLDIDAVVSAILDDYKENERDRPESIYSVRLLRQIGLCLNAERSPFFPEGVNVDFVRIIDPDEGIIEYRVFERGPRRETLACGTGAIAIAAAVTQLGLVHSDCMKLWPKSCRAHDPGAELRVKRDQSGNWWLQGNPRLLFSGSTEFPAGSGFKLKRRISSPSHITKAASL